MGPRRGGVRAATKPLPGRDGEMETRKAWRNRDSGAGQSVLALLEALRQGLGAEAVGLFDDDRGDSDPDAPAAALDFWEAFHDRSCAAIDWHSFYRELRKNQRAESTCRCGVAHRLQGFLVHGRWALLLVVSSGPSSNGAAAVASSLGALAARLPPGRTAFEISQIAAYEGEPAGAQVRPGAPVWWVRKPRQ